ncbi:major royal jelly protein-domain-containing protein [Hypoxylon fragiforme]|uniref:major royal jelly protein-domain-containing protein n=1 Tax=Hypoxylon fragiforme TaxID=63214 RepID=UPI0020C5FFB3|nr:major royal jelly protein-domain-containing protein [Hypoxylon fragiforme]KAI2603526.1 major royal jelly protein-domain-containing protein [Hypoxylon fragiforme]
MDNGQQESQYQALDECFPIIPESRRKHAFFYPSSILLVAVRPAATTLETNSTNLIIGLDPANAYNTSNDVYTVGELTSLRGETAYPSLEMNHPPGGAINYSTSPPTGANYQNYLIGVQSVVIDALDRLWILDTGRVLTASGVLVPATYGGPKLVGVNLATNTVFQTIVFPPTVAYGDSYLNDVRLDLRSGLSDTSGRGGVAYITDSSASGHSGLIVADLGTGESWRHLGLTRAVGAESQFLPFVWGQAGYYADNAGTPYTGFPIGSDGIALSADGDTLYWCPLASRYMYSVPTARLRARGAASELLAQQAVVSHGQKGVSDGLETDSNGMVYVGSMEGNAINVFNPGNGTTLTFVRDPRINWVDTMSVANDGYLYFTVNQLNFASSTFPGTDRRVRPFALFRVKLPNGGSKVSLV